MKRERYAWVSMFPAAWLLICTMTAGWQKLFDANPKIGFLAHAAKYRDALDQGKLLAPAKAMEDMHRVIVNDYIDATLCAFFMVVVVSILYYGVRACLAARRASQPTTRETGVPAPNKPVPMPGRGRRAHA